MSKFVKGFVKDQVEKVIVNKTVAGYLGCPRRYYVQLICRKGYIQYTRLVRKQSSGSMSFPKAYNLNEEQKVELEIFCEQKVDKRYK